MKRILIEYSKLTKEILDLLIEKYPDGYDYSDIIKFQNSKGETISAVEVKSEDTAYLVKISNQLEKTMEDYLDDEDSFDDLEELEDPI
mgnify:FL=1